MQKPKAPYKRPSQNVKYISTKALKAILADKPYYRSPKGLDYYDLVDDIKAVLQQREDRQLEKELALRERQEQQLLSIQIKREKISYCTRCKKWKDLSQFSLRSDGQRKEPRSQCRVCQADKQKQYREPIPF